MSTTWCFLHLCINLEEEKKRCCEAYFSWTKSYRTKEIKEAEKPKSLKKNDILLMPRISCFLQQGLIGQFIYYLFEILIRTSFMNNEISKMARRYVYIRNVASALFVN